GIQYGVGGFGRRLTDLPDPDTVVAATGQQMNSVRAEFYGEEFLQGLGKSVAAFARIYIPQFDGAVRAGAGEDFSIRPKGQAVNAPVVAGQCFPFASIS